jgi:hypothetical protein
MRENEVFNFCRAGTLITEQFRYIDDELVALFPDVTILNFGIVELFHRRTFRPINNHPIRNYYNNLILGRNYSRRPRFGDLVARAVNALTNRIGSIFGISWQWLDTRSYLQVLRAICDLAIAETSSVVFILELPRFPPTSSKYSVETDRRISQINNDVHIWAQNSSGRIIILPLNTLIPEDRTLERLIPDGIHFSAVGHRIIYSELRKRIIVIK